MAVRATNPPNSHCSRRASPPCSACPTLAAAAAAADADADAADAVVGSGAAVAVLLGVPAETRVVQLWSVPADVDVAAIAAATTGAAVVDAAVSVTGKYVHTCPETARRKRAAPQTLKTAATTEKKDTN